MLKVFSNKMMIIGCFGLVLIGSSVAAYITPERLKQDKPKIKEYIVEYTAGRIAQSQGRLVTKSMACAFGRISSEVYDSMPLEFFKNKSEIEKVIDAEIEKPETAVYIFQSIQDFKLTNQPVNDDTLGKFFFKRTVDGLNVAERYKEVLRTQPIMMEQLVKRGVIPQNDYMRFNTLHLSTKFYLEQEL